MDAGKRIRTSTAANVKFYLSVRYKYASRGDPIFYVPREIGSSPYASLLVENATDRILCRFGNTELADHFDVDRGYGVKYPNWLPKLATDGALLVGDSAGFLNSQRLKGIHLAVKSGMLAAETVFEALRRKDFSESCLSDYVRRVENSWVKQELWKTRNYHQGFEGGLLRGAFHAGLQMFTGGRGLSSRYGNRAGHEHLRKLQNGKLQNGKSQNGATSPERPMHTHWPPGA